MAAWLLPALTGLGVAGVGLQAIDFLDRWGGTPVEDQVRRSLEYAQRVQEENRLLGLEREGSLYREIVEGSRRHMANMASLQKREQINEMQWAVEKERELRALAVKSLPGPLEMIAAAREISGL